MNARYASYCQSMPTAAKAEAINPTSKPIHVEMGKMLETGAAVESTI